MYHTINHVINLKLTLEEHTKNKLVIDKSLSDRDRAGSIFVDG